MHGLVEKEKGFSLGYFDREYISRAPIATLSDADGKLLHSQHSCLYIKTDHYLSI